MSRKNAEGTTAGLKTLQWRGNSGQIGVKASGLLSTLCVTMPSYRLTALWLLGPFHPLAACKALVRIAVIWWQDVA